MATARKEHRLLVERTAEKVTQVSRFLYLLQDHQRRVPLRRDIPSFKLVETKFSYAFLDIGPVSKGHALVIPKDHAVKMHELSDEHLTDVLPIAKKIALAQGLENYNILQNNGHLAHQEVDHVHFHVIPKPSEKEGLVFGPGSWPAQKPSMDELKAYHDDLVKKLEALGKL